MGNLYYIYTNQPRKQGIKMRKILLASVFIMIACPAWSTLKYGTSMECFLDDDGNDKYWYCGGGQTSCAGVGMWAKNKRTYYSNGQAHTFDSKTYVCCGVTGSSYGKFVQIQNIDGKSWQNTGDGATAYYKKTVTVDLEDGGKCTYEARYDGCGNELTKKCSKPTNCSDGLIFRNGKCVEPCAEGSEFESVTSNKCVACETTMYQGPATMTKNPIKTALKAAKIFDQVDVDETKIDVFATAQADQPYCLKCDKSTEFYDKEKKECIKKANMIKATAQEMAQCGLCVNNLVMTDCIKCFASIGEKDGVTFEDCQEDFEDDCFFPDKQNTDTEED